MQKKEFKKSPIYKSCVAGTAIVGKRGNQMCTYTKKDGSKFNREMVEGMLITHGWKMYDPLYFVQYGQGYYILKSQRVFSRAKGSHCYLNEKEILGFIGRDLAESFRNEPFCKFFDGLTTTEGLNVILV